MRRAFISTCTVLAVLGGGPPAGARTISGVAAGSEAPWVAFIVLFGGLAVAILLIAAFGGGVGPRPVIGAPRPDAGEQHESQEDAPTEVDEEAGEAAGGAEDPPDEG